MLVEQLHIFMQCQKGISARIDLTEGSSAGSGRTFCLERFVASFSFFFFKLKYFF
jgi:hypothetical protein